MTVILLFWSNQSKTMLQLFLLCTKTIFPICQLVLFVSPLPSFFYFLPSSPSSLASSPPSFSDLFTPLFLKIWKKKIDQPINKWKNGRKNTVGVITVKKALFWKQQQFFGKKILLSNFDDITKGIQQSITLGIDNKKTK